RIVTQTPESGVVSAHEDRPAVYVHAGRAAAVESSDPFGVAGARDAGALAGVGEDPERGSVDRDRADSVAVQDGLGAAPGGRALVGGGHQRTLGCLPRSPGG